MEKFLRKLVAFNDFRQFVLTEEKDFPQLINERNIQAIATADSKTDAKSLAAYKAFDEKQSLFCPAKKPWENSSVVALQSLVVLRPLLLYPKEKKKELQKFFH
jgi:hypothetical protein